MRLHVLLSFLILIVGFSSCSHHGHHSKKHHHHTLGNIDTNQDGGISEKEWLAHSKEDFKKYDKNNDRSLSSEEYKSAGDCYHGCSCQMKDCNCMNCSNCGKDANCCKKNQDCKNCNAKKCDGESCQVKKKS